jgi:hemoglobin/transferrin/lactoferrin receptor protein
MKHFVFVLIAVIQTLPAISQILRVQDFETRKALPFVQVYSDNKSISTFTNEKGEMDIAVFKKESYLNFEILGYHKQRLSVDEIKKTNFLIQLKFKAFELNNVVISANRWEQKEAEVAYKISQITPEQIQLHNPQTAADLLGVSGEVFIQKSQQGGGSPMIRGFATNRVLLSIDGVRMNNAIFRAGNVQSVISLDPFAIENTEVLFGPNSVIYGSDAIGGVMAFQTLKPKFATNDTLSVNGSATARYASANNEFSAHSHVNIGSKRVAYVASFSHNRYQHLRMGTRNSRNEYLRPFYVERSDNVDRIVSNSNPYLQVPTAYNQLNVMQKFRYKASQTWELDYGFHYSETSPYDRYDRHIRYNNAGLPRSAEWRYGPQIWMMNMLSANYQKKTALLDEMYIRLAHQFFEESRIDRNFNNSNQRTRIEKVDAYSLNLDLRKEWNEKHSTFYGAEAVLNRVHSFGTDRNILNQNITRASSRYPNSTWSSYAAYLSHKYKVNRVVQLEAGARYNYYAIDAQFDTTFYKFPFTEANISNGALTGSLGSMIRISENTALRASFSTGFRSPNIDDIGKVFDSEPGAVVIPNPNLKAEYAHNAEIGMRSVLFNSLLVDAAVYYTYLDNALVRRDFQLNNQDSIVYDGTLSRVQAIQNAASAWVYGFQFGIEWKISSKFNFISRFNYQKGEEIMDDNSVSNSRHAAPFFGVSRLQFKHKKLMLEMNIQYSGEQTFANLNQEERGKPEIYAIDENGNPWSPGWYTINFRCMYSISNRWVVSSGVENMLDLQYRPYSSGLVAPGRNFVMSLRMNF